ncbi:substrate-binding domain-containing protein [Cellulomonas soli]|uniref:substrate-binding domain-containing protein n=1 Tax=Cellulomonas soli TaxID=931535 RepID=UPI003F86BD8E
MGTARHGQATARHTIGVLSPVVGGFYFGALIAGIARAARAAGHRVVAVQTFPAGLDRERYPDEPALHTPVGLGAVDGLVVVGSAVRHDRLASIRDWGVPFVLVSEDAVAGGGEPVVAPDNAGGVRSAVEHLLQHGHTAIGFVGHLGQRDMRERHTAYRDTLAAHGIDPLEAWCYEASDNHEQGGADAAARLVAAGTPTTAVVVATDRNAVGLQRALRASGFLLPRDQAVVGFDHTDSGARVVPRLSTVDPHYEQVGELAVAALLANLRGEEPGDLCPPSRLVLRESCGCTEAGVPNTTPGGDVQDARERLHVLAGSAFAGPAAGSTLRRIGAEAREAWWRAVLDPLESAAERGTATQVSAMARLADLTVALQPHPEALEQVVVAVRELERAVSATQPPPGHADAVSRAGTDVLQALAQGCTRALLVRSGRLERTIVDQYEVDMDLLRGVGTSPRALGWLPRGMRGPACLALWLDSDRGAGDPELEVVGVHDPTGSLTRLIGARSTASQFPPVALTRAGVVGSSDVTFVLPVTFGDSDWGLLAVDGPVETRSTSARDRFNHWAALLAVALDQDRLLASLREQRRALEQAAARERALADAMRASEERYALAALAAQDGTWDWDVSAGTVYFSTRWKQTLGYREDEIGSSPGEWLDRVHPADREEVSAAIAGQLAGSPSPFEVEHRIRTAAGDYRWMACRAVSVLDEAGCPARLVGALVDITERKEGELARQRDALRDPRTGLANRLLLEDRLGAALARTRRTATYDAAVALVRLIPGPASAGLRALPDAVRARGVLDSLVQRDAEHRTARPADAHQIVVHRLARALREGDTAARLGEDDFVLLLDDTHAAGVPARVRQLLEELRTELGPRVAIGLVDGVRGMRDVGAVLREADIAVRRGQALDEATRRPLRAEPPRPEPRRTVWSGGAPG